MTCRVKLGTYPDLVDLCRVNPQGDSLVLDGVQSKRVWVDGRQESIVSRSSSGARRREPRGLGGCRLNA